MATIIGGIGKSHAATIGLAYDKKRQNVLEKSAHVHRMQNLEDDASMRGERLDEVLSTRRVPESA